MIWECIKAAMAKDFERVVLTAFGAGLVGLILWLVYQCAMKGCAR